MAETDLIGIGYEGFDLDEFIARLRLRSVEHVVDVRLNAISRKRGFSKTALRDGLRGAGIEYTHLRELGNPRANRAGFAALAGREADDSRTQYRALLGHAAADDALETLLQISANQRTAVFCFEADEAHCHRSLILAACRDRQPLAA